MGKMPQAVAANAFALLPEAPIPWNTFAFSFVAQAVLLVLVAKSNISLMAPVFNPIDTQESVHLVAPMLEPAKPEPEHVAEVKKAPPKPIVPPKVQRKRLEQQAIEVPKVEVAKLTPPMPEVARADMLRKPALAPSGSSAPATVHKPLRQVQTGGFGDPNGVPPNANVTSKGPAIAQVGSFDLPEGPGNGNGTGGSKGARGTVASAGFGSGIAGPGNQGSGNTSGGGKVRPVDFGSGVPPAETPKRPANVSAKDTPVSLLSKPVPSYTTEARQRKIEGDVELEVEFAATGQVHVIRVLQGLGYGLDEAAVRAAEKIRFAPARHDGQAVDAEGRLKIVFRLS